MRRWIALVLSALMLLSVAGMWIHSYVAPFRLAYHRAGVVFLHVAEFRGRISLGINEASYVENGVRWDWGNPAGWERVELGSSQGDAGCQWGFQLNPLTGPTSTSKGIWGTVPIWFLFLLNAGLFLLAYRRWRRSRKPDGSHCAACGYDLTGNVSGTCPECGTGVVIEPS